jgi:quercetin dioxygenase-like cupin family protein
MKNTICQLAGYVGFALIAFTSAAKSDPLPPVRMTAGEIKWEQGAGGVQRAELAGSDKKSGMYVYRVRFPAGHRVQPHFHPDQRVVTVISGSLSVGFGERFDESAMKELSVGSVWTEPPKQPHFVFTKDGVEFQVVGGNGPSGNTPIEQK